MEVVNDNPPLFDEIDAAFNIRGKRVIFSWGDKIYNPQRIDIPAHLIVHEKAHSLQQHQYISIEAWWRRYINDPAFRLAEEILAHQAEYLHLIKGGNRHLRRRALKSVGGRLASPLYGKIITSRDAKKILKEAA